MGALPAHRQGVNNSCCATAAAIVVRPFADRVPERPETVTVRLLPSSNGSYQLAARPEGRVIILDQPRGKSLMSQRLSI